MKERGEYCYNVFKETQNFRRVFHEIPHSFEVKFVFYSFQVPLWRCLWLSLFTRFFEVQRCCSKSFEVKRSKSKLRFLFTEEISPETSPSYYE